MFNTGNPNLSFSAGASPSNVAPFTKPTQGQIGAGVDPMMLMQMLQGAQNKGGNPTQTYGQDYSGTDSAPLFQTQRDPMQVAYQQAIMKALLNRGGGLQ